jgi:transcription elongation factor Elf1
MDDEELQEIICGVRQYRCPACGAMNRALVEATPDSNTIALTCGTCRRPFEVQT